MADAVGRTKRRRTNIGKIWVMASMGRPEVIALAASHEAVLSASLPKIADPQQVTGYVAIADFEEVTLRQTENDPSGHSRLQLSVDVVQKGTRVIVAPLRDLQYLSSQYLQPGQSLDDDCNVRNLGANLKNVTKNR